MLIVRSRGFTLVELLVVIAIIATLAGMITASLTVGRRSMEKKNCRMEIDRLSLALSTYTTDFGDYPPTDIERWYNTAGNAVNSGIESLLAHLSTQNQGGPYFEFKEENLGNLDEDILRSEQVFRQLNWQFGDKQLREYLDPWGNPYVYIHNRDYERTFTISGGQEKKILVRAGVSEVTATFHSPTTFQVFSFGPNGKHENGGGDDIGSWD